ncbi:DNA binding domain, excisionase family, partial [Dysosmobacter welbionis]
SGGSPGRGPRSLLCGSRRERQQRASARRSRWCPGPAPPAGCPASHTSPPGPAGPPGPPSAAPPGCWRRK